MLTFLQRRLRLYRLRFSIWWRELPGSFRAIVVEIGEAVRRFAAQDSPRAAALAYYAIFSAFPLALLGAVAVGRLLGAALVEEQVGNVLALFLPQVTVTEIQGHLVSAIQQSASFGAIAMVTLAWSGLSLFANLTRFLDEIFEVHAPRGMWRQRVMALLISGALVVVVAMSFLTSGVLRLISALVLDQPSVWLSIGILFLPLGLNIVLFALLLRYVPGRHVHWDAIWPSALFGAIGWRIAEEGFSWYLSNLATYQFVYGGLATGIAILLWGFILAMLFLFSAQLCARLNIWVENRYLHQHLERYPLRYQISASGQPLLKPVDAQPLPPKV
jgi:membrane protein